MELKFYGYVVIVKWQTRFRMVGSKIIKMNFLELHLRLLLLLLLFYELHNWRMQPMAQHEICL